MRVLVTRPQPGAEATAARLAALGHEAAMLPLTRIVALPFAADGEAVDAVLATSANALRHADAASLAALAHLPLLAVGEATAAAAQRAGFRHVDAGEGDAAGLARLAIASVPRGSRLLYLAGRIRRGELEALLAPAGFRLETREIYDTVAATPTETELDAVFGAGAPDAMLVHSRRGAAALVALAERAPRVAAAMAEARIVAISPGVARALGERCDGAEIADAPTEAAMIARLGGTAGTGAGRDRS